MYTTFVVFKVTNLNNYDTFDSWDIGKLVSTEFNSERKPTDSVLDTYNLIRTNWTKQEVPNIENSEGVQQQIQ